MNGRKYRYWRRVFVFIVVFPGLILLATLALAAPPPPTVVTMRLADHTLDRSKSFAPASWLEVETPPPAPPPGMQLDKLAGPLSRVPDDHSPLATGKIFLLHIFVEDPGSEWISSDIPWVVDREAMMQLAKEGCDWIDEKAPGSAGLQFSNHGNPYVSYSYEVEIEPWIPHDSDGGMDWTEVAVDSLGWDDDDGSGTRVDEMLDDMLDYYPEYDWAIAMFHPNKRGRSWAYLNWNSVCVLYPQHGGGSNTEASVFAHEILHLFGAVDEYEEDSSGFCPPISEDDPPRALGPQCTDPVSHPWLDHLYVNGNCAGCSDHDGDCIMRDSNRTWWLWSPSTMCKYTKGHISWRDFDDDGTRDFAEAAPFSWFETPSRNDPVLDHITLSGRAWSPYSHVKTVQYQVNDAVDSGAWVSIGAPLDGSWDEVLETFQFNVSLPEEGENIIWIHAQNEADNWENSNLDWYRRTRDTTGPLAPSRLRTVPTLGPDVWTSANIIEIRWNTPFPDDLSGVGGYAISISTDPLDDPPAGIVTNGTSYRYATSTTNQYYAHVAAVDGLGNQGTTAHLGFKVDFTPPGLPSIGSSTHSEGTWSNEPWVDVSWEVSDAHSGVLDYGYKEDSSPTTEVTTPTTNTPEASHRFQLGERYFHVAARDAAGNWGPTGHFLLRIHTTPPAQPAPTHADPPIGASWYRRSSVTFSWEEPVTPPGIAGYSVSLWPEGPPDETVDTAATSYSYVNLSSERYIFGVRAKDQAGNWGSVGYVTIGLDTTGPGSVTNLRTTSHQEAVGVLHPRQSADPFVDITFGSATDPHSGVASYAVQWNQQEASSPTAPTATEIGSGRDYTSPELATGNWYVHVRPIDALGNWADEDDVAHLGPFVIDVTPPPAPSGVTVTSGSSEVDLSWLRPAPDIDHYVLYRSEGTDLLGAIIAPDIPDTFYHDEDESLLNGDVYIYRVAAVDSVDLMSDPSDQALGRPEYVSPGDGTSFAGLEDLANESDGGVRQVVVDDYTMHGNITISATDTLHVEPGERLRSIDRTGTRHLIIEGTLRAIGEPGDRARFGAKWEVPGAWGGILMDPPSGNCRLQEVEVRYGTTNVRWHDNDPVILDSWFSHGTGPGLDLAAGAGGICTVQNNEIRSCAEDGLSIFAPAFSNTDISENLIRNNEEGIRWTTAWPGNPPNLVDIHDNTVQNNLGDGIVCGYGGATTLIRDNVVHGNDRGIVLEFEGWMITKPIIQGNEVSSNATAGIYVSQMAQPDIVGNEIIGNPMWGIHSTLNGGPSLRDNTIHGSKIGVRVDSSDGMVPDMGTLWSAGRNQLDQHGLAYVANFTFLNMNAILNYWGSAQGAPGLAIVGPVNFMPTWNVPDNPPSIEMTEPSEVSLEVSDLVTLRWDDDDPDPADTLRVALFYDADADSLDGTAIVGASAIDGWDEVDSLSWDVRPVPSGEYFVYGIISDGTLTASSYSPGTVQVIHPEILVVNDSLTATLRRENATQVSLELGNEGEATLEFDIDEDDGAGGDVSWMSLYATQDSLEANESAFVQVALDASGLADDVHRALVVVSSNDPSDSLVTVPVALTVVHPEIAVTPDTLAFTGLSVGDSTALTATIRNAGTDTLIVTSLTGLDSPFSAVFLDSTNAAPDDTIRVEVLANAVERGSFADWLLVASNDPDASQVSIVVTAAVAGPALSLPQSSHDYGSVTIGDTTSWSYGVVNTGEDTLRVSGVHSSAETFIVVSDGVFEVVPADTVLVSTSFVPLIAGEYDGFLTMVHDDPAASGIVTLTGLGTAGSSAFRDTLLDAGAVDLGDTTGITAWLHNLGNASFDVGEAQIDSPFVMVTVGAPWMVAAGDSLGLNVRLTPQWGGLVERILSATTRDAQSASPSVRVRGTGRVPGFACDDAGLHYGLVEVGSSSTQAVTLRNPGEGSVTVDARFHGGSLFDIGTLSLPRQISAGDSLLVQVRFTPDSAVVRQDTLFVATPWAFLDTCAVALEGRGASGWPILPDLAHSFGSTGPGEERIWSMPIANEGAAAVEVMLTPPDSPFSIEGATTTSIPADSCVEVTVRFAPSTVGAWLDSIAVSWGEPSAALGAVILDGHGVEAYLVPPPSTVLGDVFEEDTGQAMLTVENAGNGVLNFAVLEHGEMLKGSSPPSCPFEMSESRGKPRSRGYPRWIGQMSSMAKREVASRDEVSLGDDVPCGLAKAPPKLGRDLQEVGIPWASVLAPYTFVCPDSTADAFIELSSAGRTAGLYRGQLLLLTSDATAESTFVDLVMRVPRMRYATHDAGNIRLTITDEGALGFFDREQGQAYGIGLEWPPASPSHLFHGSLWIADGPERVSDTSYDYDFAVIPGQELAVIQGDPQTTQCAFNDALAVNPLGTRVEQRSYAHASAPDADYVILDYALSCEEQRPGVRVGLYIDAGIGNVLANTGTYHADLDMGEMFATDGSDSVRVGIVRLAGPAPSAFRLIHNPTHVGPNYDLSDSTAWGFLISGSFDSGAPSDEYSMVLSLDPLHLMPGVSTHVAFAIAAAGSQGTLRAAANAARTRYASIVTGAEPTRSLPARFALGRPHPSPFNPRIQVPVEVPPEGGRFSLTVYDLRGRRLRTLWSGEGQPGYWELVWDGRDERGRMVASGVYVVRMGSPQGVEVRKVVLVR